MHLRWFLSAVFLSCVLSSLAFARSPRRLPPPLSLGAAISPGAHAGTLVLAFHNPSAVAVELPIRVRADSIHHDALTVELSNATTTRTLRFSGDREKSVQEYVTIEPQGIFLESIELDPMTRDLPPGEYTVEVRWDALAAATTTTFAPYHCGLVYSASLDAPPAPSKLPFLLGGLAAAALLVGIALGKRAGAADACVPHSPL